MIVPRRIHGTLLFVLLVVGMVFFGGIGVWGQSRIPMADDNWLAITGSTTLGDRDEFMVVFFEVPDTVSGPLYFAVRDPGTSTDGNGEGENGEPDDQYGVAAGDIDSYFYLLGGAGALSDPTSRELDYSASGNDPTTAGSLLTTVIGDGNADNANDGWVYFSGVSPNQGEKIGDKYYFKLVATTLDGVKNAFQLDVSTTNSGTPTGNSSVRSFAYGWTLSIQERDPAGVWSLYPFVPGSDSGQLQISNYDFDGDGSGVVYNIPNADPTNGSPAAEATPVVISGNSGTENTDYNLDGTASTVGGTWKVEYTEETTGASQVLNPSEAWNQNTGGSGVIYRTYAYYYDPDPADHIVVSEADGQAVTGGTERVTFQVVDSLGEPVPDIIDIFVRVNGSAQINSASDTGRTLPAQTAVITTDVDGIGWVDVTDSTEETVTITVLTDGSSTDGVRTADSLSGTNGSGSVTFESNPLPKMSSASNLTFAETAGANQGLPVITITDSGTADLLTDGTDTDELEIHIPAALNAGFDNLITDLSSSITITGGGTVDTTVSYPGGGPPYKIVRIDITGDFSAGDILEIDGLQLASGTYNDSTGNLELHYNGATTWNAFDDKIITITDSNTTFTWDGETDTSWTTATNWVGDVAPTDGSNIVIPAGLSNYPVVDADLTAGNTRSINNLSIDSGASVDFSTFDGEVAGTVSNNGTIYLVGYDTTNTAAQSLTFSAGNDPNSGTVVYTGDTGIGNYTGLAAGNAYYNLTFNDSTGGDDTWTLGAGLDVNGDLTVTDGTLADEGFPINVAGDWSVAAVGGYTSTGALVLDGSAAQTVSPGGSDAAHDFNNLTNSNTAATVTVTGDITVGSTLTIDAGATLQVGSSVGNTVSVTTFTNNGTLMLFGNETGSVDASTTAATAGTVHYYGNAGTSGGLPGGNTYFNLTFDNTVDGGAAIWAITGDLTVNGDLTNTAFQTIDADDGTDRDITIGGSWSRSGSYVYGTNTTGSIVEFTGTGTYSGGTVYNLTKSGVGTLALNGDTSVLGDLSISGGTLAGNGNTITLSGSWLNSAGSYTPGGGLVDFVDASVTPVTVSGDNTFYNLRCNAPGKTINFGAGNTQTVTNDLTIIGSSIADVGLKSTDSVGDASGANWNLDFDGTTYNVSYATIQDSDIVDDGTGGDLTASFSTDLYSSNDTATGTENWVFPSLRTWVGGTGGGPNINRWERADNWNPAVIPGANDDVFIANSGFTAQLFDATPPTFASLEIDNGGIVDLNTFDLNVGGGTIIDGSIIGNGSEIITIGGNADIGGAALIQAGITLLMNGTGRTLQSGISLDTVQIGDGGGDSITLMSDVTISNLTVTAGDTLNLNGYTLTVTGATATINGTLNVGAGTLSVSGNIEGTGTVDGGTGTVTVAGNLGTSGGTALANYSATSGTTTVGGHFNVTNFNRNGGTVEFNDSATTTVIAGSNDFNNLVCTTAGKTIQFTGGTTQTIAAAGSLSIIGDSSTGGDIILTSTNTTNATLSYGGSSYDVRYATISYNDVTGGPLDAFFSAEGVATTTSGWIFTGTTKIWQTGNASSSWNTGTNWSPVGVPGASDAVTIPSGGTQPILDVSADVSDLTIQAGASLTLSGFGITVNGSFYNNGTLSLVGYESVTLTNGMDTDSGTVEYTGGGTGLILGNSYNSLTLTGANTWNLNADLVVNGDITFSTAGATVNLNGYDVSLGGSWLNTGGATVNPGTASVVDFTGSAGTVLVTGTSSFGTLKSIVPGKVIQFQSGTTQTVSDNFVFQGSSFSQIHLESGTPGSQWDLQYDGGTGYVAEYLYISDSDLNGNNIDPVNSFDAGGNDGDGGGEIGTVWFTATIDNTVWLGTADTNWNNSANWQGGLIPGTGDHVTIDSTSTFTATLQNAVSLGDLTIQAGASMRTAGFTPTVGGTYTNSGTIFREVADGFSEVDTANGGTVVFEGAAGTIPDPGTSPDYANLRINGTSGNNYSLGEGIEISGNLTVQSGTFAAGANTVSVTGSISVSDTFTSSGTVSAASFSNSGLLTFSGGPVTSSGNFTSNGTLDISGMGGADTLSVGGNLDVTGGTVTSGGTGTIIMNGGAAQSIVPAGQTFDNLQISNIAATVTITGTGTFNSITIDATAVLNLGDGTTAGALITVNPSTPGTNDLLIEGNLNLDGTAGAVTLTMAGGSQINNAIAGGISVINSMNTVTITSGGAATLIGNPISLGGNGLTIGGFSTPVAHTLGASEVLTLGGAAAFTGGFTLNGAGASVVTGANTLTVGALTVSTGTIDATGVGGVTASGTVQFTSGTGFYTKGTGTFTFNAGAAQSLTCGGNDLGNIQVSAASTDLTLADVGNFDNVTVDGSTTFTTTQNFTVAGDFTNNGTLSISTPSVVTFDGAAGQTFSGTGSGGFFDLTINKSGGILDNTLLLTVSNDLTVTAGTLQLYGADLDVNHDVFLNGGTLDANGRTITVAQDWTNGGGTFADTATGSTVTFDTTADTILSGQNSFTNLSCTTGDKHIKIDYTAADPDLTVENITITGSSGSPVYLESSVATNQWTLLVSTSASISFASVSDSVVDDTSFGNLLPTDTLNGGNNDEGLAGVYWIFPAVVWNGSSDTDWGNGGNWNVGIVPGVNDDVSIPDVSGVSNRYPELTAASGSVTLVDLTIADAGGAQLDLSGYGLAVIGTYSTTSGTLLMQGGETVSIAAPATIPGTVIYYGNEDGISDTFNPLPAGLSYTDLTFTGSDTAGTADDTFQLNGDLTVTGNFNLNAGTQYAAVLDDNSNTISVAGTPNLTDGTLTALGIFELNGTSDVTLTTGGNSFAAFQATAGGGPETITVSGNFTTTGNVSIPGGHALDCGTNDSTVSIGGSLTGAGLFTAGSGTVNIDGDMTLADFTASTNQTNLAGGTITFTTLANISGLMVFDGGAAQSISAGGQNLGDVQISNTAGTVSLTGTSTLGAVTIDDGAVLALGDGTAGASVTTTASTGTDDLLVTADGGGGGGTLELNGSFAGVTLSLANGAEFSNNGAVRVVSSANTVTLREDSGTGSITYTGNDIDYNGNGITLARIDYQQAMQLAAASGEIVTLSGSVTVDSLTVGTGTVFDMDDQILTVDTGAFTVNGTLSDTTGSGTASVSAAGNVSVDAAASYANTVSLTMTGNGATLDTESRIGNLIINPGAGNTINGINNSVQIDGNLTIQSGTFDTTDSGTPRDIFLSGDWSNNGTYTSGANTVTFDATAGPVTIATGGTADGQDFNNVIFGNGTDAVTFQLTSALDVDGALTIAANGTLDADDGSGPYGISVGGNWTNSGAFTADGNTVTFDNEGPGGPYTITSGGSSFANLVVNDLGSTLQQSGGVTVSGTFDISAGTWETGDNTLTVTGAATNGGGLTSGNALVDFQNTLTSSGTLTIGTGTIQIQGNADFSGGTIDFINAVPRTLSAQGNVTFSGTTTLSNLEADDVLRFSGGNAQNLVSGGKVLPSVEVNKSGGSVTLQTNSVTQLTGSNLTFACTAASELILNSLSWTLENGVDVTANATLNVGAGTLDGDQNITVSAGTLTHTAGTVNASAFTVNGGTVTVGTGEFTASGAMSVSSGVFTQTGNNESAAGGPFTQSLGSLSVSGTGFCAWDSGGDGGSLSVGANMDQSGGTLALGAALGAKAVTVGDSITVTAGTFTPGTSTITMNGGGSSTIQYVAPSGPYNLTVDGATTIDISTSDLAVGNNLTVTNGTFDLKNRNCSVGGNVTIGASGTFIFTGSETLTIEGNDTETAWSNAGTFNTGTGTVVFEPNTLETVSLDSGGTGAGKQFYDVEINGNTVFAGDGQVALSNDLRVNNNLTINPGTTDPTGNIAAYDVGLNLNNNNLTVNGSFILNDSDPIGDELHPRLLLGAEEVLTLPPFAKDRGAIQYVSGTGPSGGDIKDFGDPDYFVLEINATGQTFSLQNNTVVADSVNVLAGSIDLNGQALSIGPGSPYTLKIASGQSLALSGAGTMVIDGNMLIEGELSAQNSIILINGIWNNNGGTFSAGNSTVWFFDSSTPGVILGDNTFYNLYCKEPASPEINPTIVAGLPGSTTPGKSVWFHANQTQTIDGSLDVRGTSGSRINLLSTYTDDDFIDQGDLSSINIINPTPNPTGLPSPNTGTSSPEQNHPEQEWFNDATEHPEQWKLTITPGASATIEYIYVELSYANVPIVPDPGMLEVRNPYNCAYNWRTQVPIEASWTLDTDGNGKIDILAVRVENDTPLDTGTSAAFDGLAIEVDGYTVSEYRTRVVELPDPPVYWDGATDPDFDDYFFIKLEEKPYLDTDAKPVWRILSNNTLKATTATATFVTAVGDQTPFDQAPPLLAYTLAMAGGDEIFIHFSEPVFQTGLSQIDGADFTFAGGALDPAVNVITNDGLGTEEVILTLTGAAAPITTAEIVGETVISVVYDLVDATNNVAPAFTPDWGAADLRITSGTTHRVSDLGLGIITPVYARNLATTRDPGRGAEIALINTFDGSEWLQPQEMEIQANVSGAGGDATLYYDSGVSDAYISSDNPGLWLPTFVESDFSGLVPIPKSTGVSSLVDEDAAANLTLHTIPDSDVKLRDNRDFDFFFQYPVTTPPAIPLYHAHLANPTAPDWYRSIRPFSFKLREVRAQTGNISILNNVINPDRGEKTTLYYELSRSGTITIQVFNLAGDLVDVLYRGRRSSGEYAVSWDGRNRAGYAVGRGIYFVRFTGPGLDEYRKVMVVR